MATIKGTVERVTYYNEENGYSVIRIKPDGRATTDIQEAQGRDGTVTVVGSMPEIGVGESLELTGEWVENSKYGKQFQVEKVVPVLPTSLEGIKRYLGSGIVKGIGEATAAKIVDHFGLATLDILTREPHRLEEVTSLKAGLAKKLAIAWEENAAVRSTMIFLQQYGVSPKMANRIIGRFGNDAVEEVKRNPYTLAEEVFGIGFKRADAVALNMGIQRDSRERIRAGLTYALGELSNEGHTFAPRDVLIDKTVELLKISEVDRSRISAVIDGQIIAKELIEDEMVIDEQAKKVIYLPMYYYAEQKSANFIVGSSIRKSPLMRSVAEYDWQSYLAELAEENAVDLTPQQQSAVKAALTSKVSVLTGGPGTGKTTTLRMVIAALEREGVTYALASPTGRAAKRLSEATERDASTIHRLLGFSPMEGFSFNEDFPLEQQFVIIDEASMIDLMLFYSLLRALKTDTHLMLVGDVDQLPSVGAGNVLHDVIDSGVAFVTRLNVIFRQEGNSQIVRNAHRINNGEMPFTDNQSDDFFFFSPSERDEMASWTAEMVIDVVTNRLPERFGVHPVYDVQVIAPMYRGQAGVDALNKSLQIALNGDRRMAEIRVKGKVFRVGDKVMQTRNNYDKDVFNGDIGYIHAIDYTDDVLEIKIDERIVSYSSGEAEELLHAYCISTHRSQGSEYPVVVMPIVMQHYMMLQRNLLYTAITRAKRIVVLVGDRKAVYMAVNNNKVAERYSGLMARLKG